MTTYVRELSAGEIIRGAVSLYRQNFGTMFLTAFVFLAPLHLVWLSVKHDALTSLIYFGVTSLLSVVAYSALVVSVSDACTNVKPSLVRSYRKVPRNALNLLTVSLLQSAAVGAGMILLIVPGVLFALWFLFSPVVVILEKTGGVAALRRSKALGEGFYGRNFGILCFFFLLLIVPGPLAAGITGGVLAGFFGIGSQSLLGTVGGLEGLLFTTLMYPLFFAGMTLTYYDMRARKESYDSTSLIEDLRR